MACEMGYSEAFGYDSAEEVFEEIKRFWNPTTGYDLRGVSYDRLRQTPLQWPCPPDGGDDRNPIRYLNDGVSQTRLVREDGSVPRLAFPTADRPGRVLRPPAPAARARCPTTTTRSCSTPGACRTNGTP